MYIERHEIVQTVGRFLVYEIQPVMVEQMGIAAPYETGPFLGIIIGIVIFRKTDGKSLFPIPLVLPFQGAQVVFKMAQHENAAGFLVGNDVDAVSSDRERTVSSGVASTFYRRWKYDGTGE